MESVLWVLQGVLSLTFLFFGASKLDPALLACTMAAAVLSHIFILRDGYAVVFPALPLILLIVVAWRRRLKSERDG